MFSGLPNLRVGFLRKPDLVFKLAIVSILINDSIIAVGARPAKVCTGRD